MKWHYLKYEGYPRWYAEIIVKCEDGKVLKTGCPYYDEDKYFHHKSFSVSYYDDEGFDADMGSLKWNNVVAWCYIEDVYEELQKQGNIVRNPLDDDRCCPVACNGDFNE